MVPGDSVCGIHLEILMGFSILHKSSALAHQSPASDVLCSFDLVSARPCGLCQKQRNLLPISRTWPPEFSDSFANSYQNVGFTVSPRLNTQNMETCETYCPQRHSALADILDHGLFKQIQMTANGTSSDVMYPYNSGLEGYGLGRLKLVEI